MVKYVIKRLDQGGGYYAGPGRAKSWTRRVVDAHRFDTREAAEADCCIGNELVVEYRP